jgi:glycosyltransferase involved in cell wall biosynthesis
VKVFLNAILLSETPSGANRRMRALLGRLPQRLPEAQILAGVQRGLAARLDFPGVRLVPMRCSGAYTALGTLQRGLLMRREVRRICRDEGVDLCHLFSLPPFSVPGVRTILTIHDNRYLLHPREYGRLRCAANLALRGRVAACDAVVTVSETVREEVERLYGARRVRVVPNGVDPPRAFWQPDRAAGRFATVLRREPRKGLDTLLEAAGEDLPVDVVGCEGRPHGFVTFAGAMDDAGRERLIARAVAFVFPSWYEGFGMPPLEAQAMGAPVIAADTPVMREVLGEAAVFFPPRNAGELREAMLCLRGDAALQERLSREGRANAARYSWDAAADALAAVYREVL